MRTIRSSRDVDRLFRQGRRASHPLVVVLATASPEDRDPGGRVVYVAGRKIGGAVQRNRSKRVLRACRARLRGAWPGMDVALVARAGTGTASPDALDAAVADALSRAGVGAS